MTSTSDSSRVGAPSDQTPSSPDSLESMDDWSSDNSSRKRAYSEGPGLKVRKPSADDTVNAKDRFHLRFLVKSQYCSRILGHGARRLADLKTRSIQGKGSMEAWISRPATTEYRVMHVVGSPETVAKFVGLVTRVILEEPEGPSSPQSRSYTLLVLMPHSIMGRLIGSRMSNFKDIERQSAAHLSADHNKLPNSDDRLIYIAGVADALHIAVYHLGVAYMKDSSTRKINSAQFEPTPGVELDIRGSAGQRDRTVPPRPSIGELSARKSEDNIKSQATQKETKESQESLAQSLPEPPKSQPPKKIIAKNPIALPPMSDDASPAVLTAYDVACSSHKPQLRQCVPVPDTKSQAVATLIENIKRVTSSEVETVDSDTLALSGAPEENSLALYLVYRFLRVKEA